VREFATGSAGFTARCITAIAAMGDYRVIAKQRFCTSDQQLDKPRSLSRRPPLAFSDDELTRKNRLFSAS
jgi:hypothetical protein